MPNVRPFPQVPRTETVDEICGEFGRELHDVFVGRPHVVARHLGSTSYESFRKYCLESDRVTRLPLSIILRALQAVTRIMGLPATQRLVNIVLRVLGLYATPLVIASTLKGDVKLEIAESSIAIGDLFATLDRCLANGVLDEKELRLVIEKYHHAENELRDVALAASCAGRNS